MIYDTKQSYLFLDPTCWIVCLFIGRPTLFLLTPFVLTWRSYVFWLNRQIFLRTGPDSYKSVTLIHYPFDSAACISLLEKSSSPYEARCKTVPHRQQRQSIRPSFGKRKKITTPQTATAAVISALLVTICLVFVKFAPFKKNLPNLTTPPLESTTSSSPQPREHLMSYILQR